MHLFQVVLCYSLSLIFCLHWSQTLKLIPEVLKLIAKLLCGSLLVASSQSWSATAAIVGAKVTYLLNDQSNYGYCMARLSINPSTVGLNCPADALVAFDCEGNFGSKAAANNLFSSAQLAFVANKSVRVTLNDSKKINGFCYVMRLDVY